MFFDIFHFTILNSINLFFISFRKEKKPAVTEDELFLYIQMNSKLYEKILSYEVNIFFIFKFCQFSRISLIKILYKVDSRHFDCQCYRTTLHFSIFFARLWSVVCSSDFRLVHGIKKIAFTSYYSFKIFQPIEMNEVIEVVERATDANINKAMLERFLDRHVSKPFVEMFRTSVRYSSFNVMRVVL